MSYKIEQIEGIGAAYAAKLAAAGIKTTDDLLAKCAAKKGRVQIAQVFHPSLSLSGPTTQTCSVLTE